jgi:REP element-mobilizing transposase RayT
MIIKAPQGRPKGRRSMSGTYANLLCHVIFSTKNRYPLITNAIQNDLHAYMGGIIREREGIGLIVGGMPDHVHLLIKVKPKFALSDIIRDVKAASSKWINETKEGLHEFGWQDGFAAFTVSQSQVEIVRRYIENQEEHHRSVDYKAELVTLLAKNQIEYDEQTVWE